MKKLLAVLLSLCLLSGFAFGEAIQTEGDFSYSVDADGNAVITAYTGANNLVAVPEELGGHPVIAIGEEAFAKLDVTVVNLPEGVVSIGKGAFKECERLISVILPEGLETIDQSAFRKCAALETVQLPESLTEINKGAFFGCESLKEITLPAALTELAPNLFYGCTALESIVVPENVLNIGSTAFGKCEKLTEVVLPEGLVELSAGVFTGCDALEELIVPESVVSIGYAAFEGLNLTVVVVSGSYAEKFCKEFGVNYAYVEEE